MGAHRNFRRGGGASPKRGPHHEVKSSKKAPKNEKKVANRPPYEEKVAKRPPIEPKHFFSFSRGEGGGRRPTLAGAHACNRVALIFTISCIKKVNINKKIDGEIVSNTL